DIAHDSTDDLVSEQMEGANVIAEHGAQFTHHLRGCQQTPERADGFLFEQPACCYQRVRVVEEVRDSAESTQRRHGHDVRVVEVLVAETLFRIRMESPVVDAIEEAVLGGVPKAPGCDRLARHVHGACSAIRGSAHAGCASAPPCSTTSTGSSSSCGNSWQKSQASGFTLTASSVRSAPPEHGDD